MSDMAELAILAAAGSLLTITVVAAIRYYALIRMARLEYEKARSLVEEIVRSFNRELKRDTEKVNIVLYKAEGNSARIETIAKRVDGVEKRAAPFDSQLATVSEVVEKVAVDLKETNSRMLNLSEEHETLKSRLANLQEQIDKIPVQAEVKVESAIPIKRDKAMAALTETEVAVLEMLAAEGPKTAPQIKEKVQLSREHTARLMKKLYEEGYLERLTDKIPFKYNVKKEMEKFLKKSAPPTA